MEGDGTNKNLFFNYSLVCENRIYQDTLGNTLFTVLNTDNPRANKSTRLHSAEITADLWRPHGTSFLWKIPALRDRPEGLVTAMEKLDFHMWRYSCTFKRNSSIYSIRQDAEWSLFNENVLCCQMKNKKIGFPFVFKIRLTLQLFMQKSLGHEPHNNQIK